MDLQQLSILFEDGEACGLESVFRRLRCSKELRGKRKRILNIFFVNFRRFVNIFMEQNNFGFSSISSKYFPIFIKRTISFFPGYPTVNQINFQRDFSVHCMVSRENLTKLFEKTFSSAQKLKPPRSESFVCHAERNSFD